MEEKKDNKKTWAIVGTVAAILFCGCPGLSLCVSGVVTLFGGMPDFVNGYGNLAAGWGAAFLCLAILGIAVAVLVPVLTLKKKKAVTAEEILPPGDLPPAS